MGMDILLIENDVEFFGKHKAEFERSFSKKDLSEAAYILASRYIEIDQDA